MNDDPFSSRPAEIYLPAAHQNTIPLRAGSDGYGSTPPAPSTAENLDLSWSQPPGMTGLCFKNFLYRIVTFGIYNFWGKTEVRKRIWSAIRINGEPLQYTGTGKEMFLGFLFVLAVVTIPALLLALALSLAFGQGATSLMQIGFFYLIGVAMHRAIRYRLSRTLWRGIRGGLDGSAWKYGWTYFWTGFILIITLGWASPWRATKLQSLIVNGMRFGNRPFKFDALSGPLYGPFLALWLSGIAIVMGIGFAYYAMYNYAEPLFAKVLVPGRPPDPASLFTLILILYGVLIVGLLLYAIVSAWYRAQTMNHFAAHTTFEGARFTASATGSSLVGLTITNLLMVICTLGLLSPLAQARSARYFIQRLRIDGSADLDQVLQGAASTGRGEGLAQAFDIDAF
jgi:uncharacterized membrane protein YjgN (DUF898 family)